MRNEGVVSEVEHAMGVDSDVVPEFAIPRRDVERWMRSKDLEVLGAVSTLILEYKYYIRITPPLAFEDYHEFMMRYLTRCLIEDSEGEWADSRYSAGWTLCSWFEKLWADETVRRSAMTELKLWMRKLYANGDEALRTCLVTATFEHLFQNRAIRNFFRDWMSDPVMHEAYKEAIFYSRQLPQENKNT